MAGNSLNGKNAIPGLSLPFPSTWSRRISAASTLLSLGLLKSLYVCLCKFPRFSEDLEFGKQTNKCTHYLSLFKTSWLHWSPEPKVRDEEKGKGPTQCKRARMSPYVKAWWSTYVWEINTMRFIICPIPQIANIVPILCKKSFGDREKNGKDYQDDSETVVNLFFFLNFQVS